MRKEEFTFFQELREQTVLERMVFTFGVEVEIGQDIAVENHRRLANQILGKLIGAGSAHWLRFDRIFQFHAELRAVAELLFNLFGLIRKRKRDVDDAGAPQGVNLIEQKRSIANWNNRLWGVDGQRTQPCALTTSEYQCLHDCLIW